MNKDPYLDEVEEETGKLFQSWAAKGYDVNNMVTSYMKSLLRERIDKRYAWFCTKSASDQEDEITPLMGSTIYDETLCEWLGCFYSRLQSTKGIMSKQIIVKYPFLSMYTKSRVLHDLDMDLAIQKVTGSF